jgi:CheY-like chemotaxis protein
MQRVVLVDDDASIRRLVELALEEWPIELVLCAGAAEARAALLAAPAALVITDLMMPGESGYDLLEWLMQRPDVRASARLVAFSAGIDGAARARLAALGVWRGLDKPVSVAALEACVLEALGQAPPATAHAVSPASLPAGAPASDSRAAESQLAVERNFGGDAALHGAFRAQVLLQFGADIEDAERLLAAGDLPALRRLAHSLKGVLGLLGHEADAGIARGLEQAAAAGDAALCRAGWPVLRAVLSGMLEESG